MIDYGWKKMKEGNEVIPLKKKAIKEFEMIINLAELKALSKESLRRPLSDREFKRMKGLATKVGIIKK